MQWPGCDLPDDRPVREMLGEVPAFDTRVVAGAIQVRMPGAG
jgi:hypothetical protein